jgi:hypothetical protein
MRFSTENFECRLAMTRATTNARVRRQNTVPAELRGLDGDALGEALLNRVAVMFCGSREKFDSIFAPAKEAFCDPS